MTVNSALNVEEAGLFPGWNDRKFVPRKDNGWRLQ